MGLFHSQDPNSADVVVLAGGIEVVSLKYTLFFSNSSSFVAEKCQTLSDIF
jgi:hypothetical protein